MRREATGRKKTLKGKPSISTINVRKQLIEESQKLGKALGVEVADDRSSWALSFTGGKPQRLQPPIFDDVGKHIEIMDQGQVGMAAPTVWAIA